MRVLWVSLVEFPPLCRHLGKDVPAHCGWLYASAKALIGRMPDVRLGVVIPTTDRHAAHYDVEGISYDLVPTRSIQRTDRRQTDACREAIARFAPDLIHIHGTEYSLAEAVCRANGGAVSTLVNIQGLAGPYMRYADGGLSLCDKLLNVTPLDFYRGTFLMAAKHQFRHRAECERYVLTHATDIVGRTLWDHDHALTVNPALRYHFMNETLRDSFYAAPCWSAAQCRRHTVFVSNSGSALKGAHQMVKALPILLRDFPDTVVRFCGSSVMSRRPRDLVRLQGYHLYLRRLVNRLGVGAHVEFLGSLSESQMKQEFLNAHVYVMPSAIENSPNSLCEAQILGTPCVASYCGGTPTLLTDGETGHLYRYEEHEMLAQSVARLFRSTDAQLTALSEAERSTALSRHDREKNADRLAEIYRTICK